MQRPVACNGQISCSLFPTMELISNAWFNFTCYHPPPPGQPRGQVQPFGPGGGELFEAVLSRGEGSGENPKKFLLVLVKYVNSRLTPDPCFWGKSLEFVADWLEENNLSKLKSVFEGTFVINS